MRIKRITLSAQEVLQQKEPEFQKKFTKKLKRAGFNFSDPIIRQKRSDIDGGVDFIQLRYNFLDRFDLIDKKYYLGLLFLILVSAFFLWQFIGGMYISGHPFSHIWLVPDATMTQNDLCGDEPQEGGYCINNKN